MDPWFSEQAAGMIGAGLGTGIGVVLGGVGGGIGGPLAAMGKARGLVLGVFWLGFMLGIMLGLASLVALILDQPWHVWFVLALPAVLSIVLSGLLLGVMRAQYARAEQRKMDAAAIRGA